MVGLLSTATLVWHIKVKPMDSRTENLVYTMNEYFYFVCILFTLGLTNYSPEPSQRYSIGWCFFGLIISIAAFNAVYLLVVIVRALKMQLKKYCLKRHRHKTSKATQRNRNELKSHLKSNFDPAIDIKDADARVSSIQDINTEAILNNAASDKKYFEQ